MPRGLKPWAALLVLPLVSAATTQEDYGAPYRILQEANHRLDPTLAASAYATDGALIFEIPGQPPEQFRGAKAIRAAYVRTFGQVEAGRPIELEFRFATPGPGPGPHTGAYRVKARAAGRDITVYGRFSVSLVKQDGTWRFASDRGTVASAADFDALPPSNLVHPSSLTTKITTASP